jgi:hypothetical protein
MSLQGIVLASLIVASSVSYSQINNSNVKASSKNEKIEVKSGYGTTYNISKKNAEKQIRQLAKTSKIEDAWMYYDNMLVDIGSSENDSTVTVNINPNIKIDSGSTVTFYHIHPNIEFSPPSILDIINHPKQYQIFKNNKVVAKVFDEKHEWEYNPSNELLKKLEDKELYDKYFHLRKTIDLAYDPQNIFFLKSHGKTLYQYRPKKKKEHIQLMREIGVVIKCKKIVLNL